MIPAGFPQQSQWGSRQEVRNCWFFACLCAGAPAYSTSLPLQVKSHIEQAVVIQRTEYGLLNYLVRLTLKRSANLALCIWSIRISTWHKKNISCMYFNSKILMSVQSIPFISAYFSFNSAWNPFFKHTHLKIIYWKYKFRKPWHLEEIVVGRFNHLWWTPHNVFLKRKPWVKMRNDGLCITNLLKQGILNVTSSILYKFTKIQIQLYSVHLIITIIKIGSPIRTSNTFLPRQAKTAEI